MINTDMREYDFYTYGDADGYGQPVLLGVARLGEAKIGSIQLGKARRDTIRMAIYTTAQAIQNNIAYKNASYVGLTHDRKVNDTYVIEYENKRLKVLYVGKKGVYRQVFMGDM